MQDTALNSHGSSPCPAPLDFPHTPFQNFSSPSKKASDEQKVMDLSKVAAAKQTKVNHYENTKDIVDETKELSSCEEHFFKPEDSIAPRESKMETCDNKESDHEEENFGSEGSSDDSGSHKTNEDESEKRYVCPICDVVLFSPHDSTLHIRSHNNNITSPEHSQLSTIGKGFICSICGKVLSSSSSLDRHVLVHSGERPFKCQICGFSFTTNGNMHRHMRTHPNVNKTDNYESDASSDSCGKSSTSPPPTVSCKKRKVSRTNTEFNNNIELSPRLVSDLKRKSPDLEETKLRKIKTDLKQDLPSQTFNCPVCKRVNFATLNVLETHLEDSHPEYKARCDGCNLIFKNYRVLNLHRFMVHFDDSDEMMAAEGTVGFKDLTFVDFSSEKFPHIARMVCEQSLHHASSIYHKFQCEKCCRAFPCGSALNIHQQSCGITNYASSGESNLESDNEMPTDLSNSRRRKQSWPERNLSECSEEVEDERKRENFFAGLDLQNKSVPLSPVDDTPPRYETFQSDQYFSTNMEGKDLADIQSIISVTSAGSLIPDLSKSPQPTVLEVTPPDSGSRGGAYDTGIADEELQDCFAAEFRKMKLRGEFPCRLCDKKFPNLRALKGHNRVHLTNSSGGSNAPYRCNMCPHFSSDKSALIRHMRTHNGDRPYECGLCHYAFTTKANCERHLRNRHAKMTREDVKKSIIYHPSEDPTNDIEQKSSRDEVKRSLFSEKDQMKENNSVDIPIKTPVVEELKMPKLESALRSYHIEQLHSTSSFVQIKKPNYTPANVENEIHQRRKSLDVGTMTFSEDESMEHCGNSIHPLIVPPKRINIETPLDLTMDVLDLSKKKKKMNDDIDEKIVKEEIVDVCEPQDLSKKSKMCDGSTMTSKQSSPVCFGTVQKPNLPSCLPIPFSQELNVLTPPSMNQSFETQTTPRFSSPTITIPKLDLSSLYSGSPHLNSHPFYPHGFPTFPTSTPLPPGPFPPYFIPPPPPHVIFPRNPPHDFVEMKERLQKELIRGLQLTSGGSLVLDQLAMASAADRIQALHQQALAEYSRHLESTKIEPKNFSPTITNENKSIPPPPELEKIQNNDQTKHQDKSAVMKPRHESTSVKMVIKNGVLIPKQKQRRYRTERPFSCEHCSARFTLRSNMERHIKQQHPQYWTQRQRNAGNITIRRSTQKIPSSFVPPHGIFSQIDIGNKEKDHDNDDYDEDNEDMSRSSTPHDDFKSEIVQSLKGVNVEEKTYISDEVKYAIAQQLKSKLQPTEDRQDEKYNSDFIMDDEEVEENEELVIDEETRGEEDEKEVKKEVKKGDELQISKRIIKEENVVDLASVSRLLDNASTQTFRQYFHSEEDNAAGEGSEEDEEGLVAGSASEGNNSGSDENKSDADLNTTNNINAPKKKSAYSLAPNRVSCPYCFRKFPWSSSLRRHVLTHTGQKPYKCSFCPLLFTTKSNCDRHLLRKHGGGTVSVPVEKTTAQIRSEPNVNQTPQNYTMRNVPERPYKCKYCPSSTFSTMSNLKKHVENKHQNSGKNDRVPDSSFSGYESQGSCSGDIDVDGEQTTHQDITPENKDKKTVIDGREIHPGHLESVQYAKPTQTPLAVDQNYSTPLNADLPFKCHLCDGSFSDRQEALEHIRENHSTEFQLLVSKGALEASGSNEENICSEEGAGEESLEQLRGKFPDYANRKVMCAFCLRRFWSAEDLRRHMRTHTGERPFSCDICRRRFTLKHSMLRHRKKHSFTPATQGETSPGSDDEVHNTTLPTTNHNNNTIPTVKQWSRTRNDEETDLISNLLGIQDKSIVDKMLLSKSADDAAKLLGVQK